ncbi:MAG TPA: nucleotidyltransferase family protein [Nevskiales bacterium]|nr:nucleotidyltransferase family protein [Nevskiales bacterium]
MKAMILAAGRGERMRPLTDRLPKPLLPVCGRALLDYHLEALARAGFRDVVINIAYRGVQVVEHCRRRDYGLALHFSDEGPTALETGGGIRRALPLLGGGPFAVINGDIHTDYPFTQLLHRGQALPADRLAHLVMVPNPPHRPDGDFGLMDGLLHGEGGPKLTFSGIGLYRAGLFAGTQDGAFPLAPLLRAAMREGRVSGERYEGRWCDVGTPERLAQLEAELGC